MLGHGQTTSSPPSPVELEFFFYTDSYEDSLETLVDLYQAEHPEVRISLVSGYGNPWGTLQQRYNEGVFPDLVQLMGHGPVQEYGAKGALMDLSEEGFRDGLIPGTQEPVSLQGRFYAFPLEFNGIGIIYNKKIMARYGLAVPRTLGELQVCAQTLKKNNVTPFAALLKSSWSAGHVLSLVHTTLLGAKGGTPGIYDFLEKMNHQKISFGKAVAWKDLTAILDWYRDNLGTGAEEMDWDEQQQVFADGKAAMMVQGLWSYQAVLGRNPDLSCGFFPFPVGDQPKDSQFFADVDSGLGVSALGTPEKRRAALEFLRWLARPEIQRRWMGELGRPFCTQLPDYAFLPPVYQDFMNSVLSKGHYPWAFLYYPIQTFEGAVKSSAQAYLLGQKTALQLAKDIDQSWAEAVR